MKSSYLILLIILSQGCVTQKRCAKRFPPVADTIQYVTVKDSIVYRDTVIYVSVPGRVIIDSIIIPCPPPPPEYIPDTARAETEFATAKAWWSYPVIQLELNQKPLNLSFKLDSVIKDAYHWKSEYERVTKVIKEKYVPKWITFFAITGGVLIALIIGITLVKFKLI